MSSSLHVLRNQILDAGPVLETLDAEMEKIRFDPLIPASVDAANERIGRVIETLLADFKGNPILGPLAVELKSQYLEGIEEQVAAARALA